MKPFTKRLALVMGLLFTALICMGIVYIDNVKHYWQFSGGFVRLVVNTNAQAIMTVDTNTLRVGFNTNNITHSFVVAGRKPATNSAGDGASATSFGAIVLVAGSGGETTGDNTLNPRGGNGGPITISGGGAGSALSSTTNGSGGTGGSVNLSGGTGGTALVATSSITSGPGGNIVVLSGLGGDVPFPATNAVGGNSGAISLTSATGITPSQGWSRKPGNGGGITLTAGNGGGAARTNGANGGTVNIFSGSGGNAQTTPGDGGSPGGFNITAGNGGSAVAGGNPQPGANITLTAGNGSTGDTNSDSGHVFIAGGAPGSGAVPGNVVLARTSAGTSRGAGVQIGPLITGGSATVTNILGAAASLNFPLTAAGDQNDLPITVTGVTSNNCAVALSVPWMSASSNGVFTTYASNDTIWVRFTNTQLLSPANPNDGTFSVVVFRIR